MKDLLRGLGRLLGWTAEDWLLDGVVVAAAILLVIGIRGC